ncbi:MAG: 2-C-methyl-D-erythritol 4-phosphate cytidylyltransferase [bacterium]|nr:2-C-methyl-D-erythritol 4-phosphate cytidylyltransferase [bacterium]
MTTAAVIPAAGSGRRMGETAKPLLDIGGIPVIIHTLRALLGSGKIDHALIVCREAEMPLYRRLLVEHNLDRVGTTAGGAERQNSVFNGLRQLRGQADRVLIHDAVRPFIDEDILDRVIEPLGRYAGVVAGVPLKDTVKEIAADGTVVNTPPRERLWAVQTPQAFDFQTVYESHQAAERDGFYGTDDAVLLERRGIPVLMVQGSYENIKLTTTEDIRLAEALIQPTTAPAGRIPRVGTGYDSHRLVEGRPLVLGGVTVPHTMGLQGHSDADVLLHALADALLGAAGEGDIGGLFPDTDPRWHGADSADLLLQVRLLIEERGFRLINADMTVVAQSPRLAPHIPLMRARIAGIMETDIGNINIKAKTAEGMGPIGNGEGIEAYAVVLVE